MLSIESSGSFKNSQSFLQRLLGDQIAQALRKYGQEGVDALSNATPIDSGLTASSWRYEVKRSGKSYSIIWSNTHVEDGRPVAILLQYGHGTGTGGWVQGRDYINPVILPLFDKIADDVWRVVTK